MYYRGFSSTAIFRATGYRYAGVRNELKRQKRDWSKQAIVNFQVNWIKTHYDRQTIIAAYQKMMDATKTTDNRQKLSRGKKIRLLGCRFGSYPTVLRKVLGNDVFQKLQNEYWQQKQIQTMQTRYGVSNSFDKRVFSDFVSDEAIQKGREQRILTLQKRYGVDSPLKDPKLFQKMLRTRNKTNLARYGVENPMQNSAIAYKSNQQRQQTMLDRYGVKNSVESDAIREKIFDRRVKNGTVNTSLPEETMYQLLVALFGADDVKRNCLVDQRYPFHVDFYIPSRDLFIELNGDRSHYTHWFDPTNKDDLIVLDAWEQSAQASKQPRSRYHRFIDVWTRTDVMKRQAAQTAGLNYLVFWDGGAVHQNKRRVARLRDFYEWVNAGCPDSIDFRPQNTY